jgi:hypothetical protein
VHTFAVSDVEKPKTALAAASLATLLTQLKEFGVEATGANFSSLVLAPMNPFVGAVHFAYAEHYPLALSPDDVWVTLAHGFATHVDQNAEALRGRFVRHEGRQIIRIVRDDFRKRSATNDWPGCFAEFSDQIATHIGKQRDLVVANFSTTGAIEKAVSEIALMGAMKNYFDYGMMTLCGIPEVTLLGTTEDWRSIRRRAEVFAEYDLGWWTKELLPVLDELVKASSGSPDVAFWRGFYKQVNASGGPFISGWINAFFPYLCSVEDGRPVTFRSESIAWETLTRDEGPGLDDFPPGLMRVPFLWEYFGTEIPMELLGGFMGVYQEPGDHTVRPALGWAVSDPARDATAS